MVVHLTIICQIVHFFLCTILSVILLCTQNIICALYIVHQLIVHKVYSAWTIKLHLKSCSKKSAQFDILLLGAQPFPCTILKCRIVRMPFIVMLKTIITSKKEEKWSNLQLGAIFNFNFWNGYNYNQKEVQVSEQSNSWSSFENMYD